MLLVLNENISLDLHNPLLDSSIIGLLTAKEFIYIQNRKFEIIRPSELVRKRNQKDGYYRVIYIQINFETGEYYIGKSNRPTWKQLLRYQGSGLKFRLKFNKHKENFVRYFIAQCSSAEETEHLEAEIITDRLLEDPLCLNLVAGGGGQPKTGFDEDRRESLRLRMKQNPDLYEAMQQRAKEIFSKQNDSQALKERNERIKLTMQKEEYREMSRERLTNWREQNPEQYKQARIKNAEAVRKPEAQQKRKASFEKWKRENPEAFALWEEKRRQACHSEASKQKRRESLKKFKLENPEQYALMTAKRAQAAKLSRAKKVVMVNLETNDVLMHFDSARDAARWLLEQGKTKTLNAAGSICSVCSKKQTPGHGVRKSAFGFGWKFADE